MAGAFSGLLAYAIVKMDGVGNYAGWRWIFILEGLLTVAVAIASYFLLYDFPDTAPFLTREERAWATYRLRYQGSQGSGRLIAESDRFEWKFVRQALTDWQLYICLFMYWGIVCPLYGISLFLPTIINDLGYTSATAQLLTIPIYITAAVLSITICYFSDRAAKAGRSRYPYIFWPMVAILVGFIMAIAGSAQGNVPGVVYAGVFIATCGIYPAFPGNIAWISNNLAGSYKRSAGMAFQIGIGNLVCFPSFSFLSFLSPHLIIPKFLVTQVANIQQGGAMASNFYRPQDAKQYILGHALEIAFVVMGLISVIVLRVSYSRINAKRDKEGASGAELTDAQLSDLGDRAPTFRYQL
jgi:Major Facilitator Superfamily